MMYPPEYLTSAYKKAVWRALQRYLTDQYMDHGGSAERELHSEDLPPTQSKVPQEVLLDILGEIDELERGARQQMAVFEMRRKEDK